MEKPALTPKSEAPLVVQWSRPLLPMQRFPSGESSNPGQGRRGLQSSKVLTLMWYSQITHSVRVQVAAPPLCTNLLLHTPIKHLTHEQPAQSTTLSNLDAWGEPCGSVCTQHLPEVSCHYGVTVKCVASGQCSPGLILGWCRSWSQRLLSSKLHKFFYCIKVCVQKLTLMMFVSCYTVKSVCIKIYRINCVTVWKVWV